MNPINLVRLFRRKRTDLPNRLVSDEEGFSFYVGEDERWRVRWDEIEQIVAYKLDLFTVDQLRLDFLTHTGAKITIHEDLDGFNEFRERMDASLPHIKPGWWSMVVFPAFDENRTVIYPYEP